MTFSVTKSYLSTMAGLVLESCTGDETFGLDTFVLDSEGVLDVKDASAELNHNRGITWRHLLQQTSEWSGVLWSKPGMNDDIR